MQRQQIGRWLGATGALALAAVIAALAIHIADPTPAWWATAGGIALTAIAAMIAGAVLTAGKRRYPRP